jgi:adenylate cyclase
MTEFFSLAHIKQTLGEMRNSRLAEQKLARNNPFLQKALEEEKLQGQAIATYSRIAALIIIALLLFVVNNTNSVYYYQSFLLVFVVIAFLQLRMARVGQSGAELLLIISDFALLTFISVAPNPFLDHEVPRGFPYIFDNFIYFFVLLAGASLAYSWRTIWSIGTWVPIMWIIGMAWTYWFGHTIPEISAQIAEVFKNYPALIEMYDPNSINYDLRIQEMVVFFLVAAIIALKGRRSNQLLLRQADLAAERSNLSRYFSPNMVEVLASNKEGLDAVRSQKVAVLFADINGFTKIAEQHSPERVMGLLREFHAILGNAIFANHGTLDKYLGDGIMATFGTPFSGQDDALNALKAAKKIVSDVDAYNAQHADENTPLFRVCVGIHYGEVILGNIGPTSRLEFAVLGDTVNVAARLESMTRQLGCRIIASNELFEQIKLADSKSDQLLTFNAHPALPLKGREKTIDVWVA